MVKSFKLSLAKEKEKSEVLKRKLDDSKISHAKFEESHGDLTKYYATLNGSFKALKVSHENIKVNNLPSSSETSSIVIASSSSYIIFFQ